MRSGIKFLIGVILLFIAVPISKVEAKGVNNSFITIVNPVRISAYSPDPIKSLKAEYEEVKKRELPASWLLTYDVISDKSIIDLFSSMDKKQEFGIFLEVTENFCKDSLVSYNKTDGWQRATSVFLSGYAQNDRKKLIDKVFSKFKDRFGYFPKSVGGWWVDSFSLSYMKEKYGITGVLGLSDQYDLDGYQLWGTPWSVPFYPSKIHAGVSAGSISQKLDVVTFRWAERDPLNGYLAPGKKAASLYSVQDYPSIGQSNEYLEKLIDLYAFQKDYNQYGHFTIGLEGDYSADVYQSIYSKRMDLVKKFSEDGISVITMKDFSKFYQKTFPHLSPVQVIESKDLIGTKKQSFWIQTNSYRIGLIYNFENQKLKLLDFRIYQDNLLEPYYISPNKDFELSINLPFVIDSVIDKNSVFDFKLGEFQEIKKDETQARIVFKNGSILFKDGEIIFPKKIKLPPNLTNSKLISLNNSKGHISIIPKKDFYVPKEGIVITDFSFRIPFALKIRIERYLPIFFLGAFTIIVLLLKLRKHIVRYNFPLLILIVVLSLSYIFVKTNSKYYVSQTEADGLKVLSELPKGKVLVYDKDCIRCRFRTKLKPAAAEGIKNYVSSISGMEVLINYSFMTGKNSRISRKILSDKNIDYIYLVKYEDYIESLPYLPQDLGIEKIYENANSEIWRVK